jgi:uncharacterized protein YjbI with pentapeptide repeats
VLVVLILVFGVVAAGALAYAIRRFGWSYLTHRVRWKWTGFRGKTLWDWLQLLVVPLALAGIALGFNLLQSVREQKHEDARKQNELRIAAEARREDALSAYLQRMSELTLQHRLASHPSKDVALLAQNLTHTVLRRLDGPRKGHVLQFLADAGLLRGGYKPVISLRHADLRNLSLRDGEFGIPDGEKDAASTSLIGADLRHADFHGAALFDIRLDWADLRGADFTDAGLSFVVYSHACLTNTNFSRALLQDSDLSQAFGHDVDFTKATLEVIAKNHQLQQLQQDGSTGERLRPFTRRPSSSPASPKKQDHDCDRLTG